MKICDFSNLQGQMKLNRAYLKLANFTTAANLYVECVKMCISIQDFHNINNRSTPCVEEEENGRLFITVGTSFRQQSF